MKSPRALWSAAKDASRTELWPFPTLAVLLALGLGIGLPSLDSLINRGGQDSTGYLFAGGPDAARTVLSAISGSLITVTSLTFSLTVVTLQLASSQFSPRLLRTFTRDRFVHLTLALFLATFTYSLTVLRSVRTGDDGQDAFVPRLAVTFSYVLTVASVFALVLFLAHLAREIRVETMLSNVRGEAEETMTRVLPERPHAEHAPLAPPPDDASVLTCDRSGFLTYIDEDSLLKAACAAGAVVQLDRLPGASIVDGGPIGQAWSVEGTELDLEAVTSGVRGALSTGDERTAAQDVAFGLRQLTDVATKALSPGINDPTTAVHALGHSASLLALATGRDLGPRVLRDEQERIRVVALRPTFDQLLDLAVAQPRRYGAAEPAVLSRLAQLLAELAWCTRDTHQRRAVADQAGRLRRTTAQQDLDPHESAELGDQLDAVDAALAGTYVPTGEP